MIPTPMIIAADETWHRPLTTPELAALQGFPLVLGGKPLVLTGSSHTRWREALGNAVPPPAALAIGERLLRALVLTTLSVFALSGVTRCGSRRIGGSRESPPHVDDARLVTG